MRSVLEEKMRNIAGGMLAQSSILEEMKLLKEVQDQSGNEHRDCECLDILCDVLHKFGNLMVTDHDLLLEALLSQLSSNQASVRKKIVSCIGYEQSCSTPNFTNQHS